MFPVGFAFGALEVAIPAFADAEGRPELAGVLIAIWSVASLAGGLAYGAMPRRGSLARVHLQVALAAAALLPPARARRLARDDGAARRPGGHLHRADDRHAQRARRPGRARRARRRRPTRGRSPRSSAGSRSARPPPARSSDSTSWQIAVLVAAGVRRARRAARRRAAARRSCRRRERARRAARDGAVPARRGSDVRRHVLDPGDPARARARVRRLARAGRAEHLRRDRRGRARRLVLGPAVGPDRPPRVARRGERADRRALGARPARAVVRRRCSRCACSRACACRGCSPSGCRT